MELSCVSRHNPLQVMAVRAVIGRDNELAALEAFLADVERAPTALVLSGEAGIDWEVGVDEALTPKDR